MVVSITFYLNISTLKMKITTLNETVLILVLGKKCDKFVKEFVGNVCFPITQTNIMLIIDDQ